MTASRHYLNSSSFKMALLFAVLLGLSAALLGYLLDDFGRQDFLRETEAAIDAEISMLKSTPRENLTAYIGQRMNSDPNVHFRYEDEKGIWLAGNIHDLPKQVSPLAEGVLRFSLQTQQGQQVLAAKIVTLKDGSRVFVARDIHSLIESYESLKALSIVMMLFMLVVVLVSFGISYFVVSRINRIAVTAQWIISTGDLSQRIAIETQWDDLSNLAQVLNQFLEEIEVLMTGIREVSNNIAHDLRTPLARLRNDIESLKGRRVDERELDALNAEIDRIMGMFHSLLRIANIEKGKRHQGLGSVKLCTLLQDVTELYEPVAEEKQIMLQLTCPAELEVRGDPDLLFQLFLNLLDNAIKFSPAGSAVKLYAKAEADAVAITVEDSGPGIPDNEKETVFRHFYRGDSSRSLPGNGLGLSLVKAVINQHHGKISFTDNHPGLKVHIRLQPYQ